MLKFLLILVFIFPLICQADITTGLVGWWKLDETSGNVSDSSSLNNTGVNTGSTGTSGIVKNARSFNGTDTFITLPDDANFQWGSTDFTMCAWFYPASITGNRWFLGDIGLVGGGANFGISGGTLNITKNNVDGGTSDSTTINLNQWQFGCAVFDNAATSNNLIYFYNGLQKTTVTMNVDFQALQGTRCIGASDCGLTAAGLFSGKLDEVRMYNRKLTAADIKQLYQATGNNSFINPSL